MKISQTHKKLLILPSSVIFFLIVPSISIILGKKVDLIIGITFDLEFTGILMSIIFLFTGIFYVFASIKILLEKGGGIPLGDLIPKEQTNELITSGVYAQTRNPMIFGYLLCLIAMGLLTMSITVTLIIPFFFVIIWTLWLKIKEEPALEERFGNKYTEYMKKVPYLIPRLIKNTN